MGSTGKGLQRKALTACLPCLEGFVQGGLVEFFADEDGLGFFPFFRAGQAVLAACDVEAEQGAANGNVALATDPK